MQYLSYILIYTLLKGISLLPIFVLHILSNFIYYLVFYVIKYRVKVVEKNINLVFPDLSQKEKKQIQKKFYRHFCDMFIEMIKTLSISENEMKKRFKFTNLELLKSYQKNGKSILIMSSHYASWEWSIIIGKYIDLKAFAVYKKIQNKYFDKLAHRIRSKYNAHLLATNKAMKTIKKSEEQQQQNIYAFLSDQSPMLKDNNHWDSFMNIEVPIHMGAEVLIRKNNLNVLFMKTKRTKRGFYEATFIELAKKPKELALYELTRRFLDKVEEQITEEPYLYFWTHNRWKHKDSKKTMN